MPEKPVQEQLGQAIVEAVTTFALKDVATPDELQTGIFKHIRDPQLRKCLAETLFGARWLYKLGLVTLVRNEQRAAHVRAQVVDYTAICEGILADSVCHGVYRKHFHGTWWKTDHQKPLNWPSDTAGVRREVRRRSLAWLVWVASEEGIVSTDLADDLTWLRKRRNAVHLAEMAAMQDKSYLSTSKKAYEVMHATAEATAHWKSMNP